MTNNMSPTGRMRIQHPPMQQVSKYSTDPIIKASIEYFEAYYAFVIRSLRDMVNKENNRE